MKKMSLAALSAAMIVVMLISTAAVAQEPGFICSDPVSQEAAFSVSEDAPACVWYDPPCQSMEPWAYCLGPGHWPGLLSLDCPPELPYDVVIGSELAFEEGVCKYSYVCCNTSSPTL